MTSDPRITTPRKRPWGKILIFLVAVGLFLLIFGNRLWWTVRGVTPADLITVSRETTYLIEPLDPAGLVDYLEALNREASEGITPENNFEVVVRSILGTRHIDIGQSEQAFYFARLGIPLREPDETYESLEDFTYSKKPDGNDAESLDRAMDEAEALTLRLSEPWTADEFPEEAAHVAKNARFLDALVEGSRRERDYVPLTSILCPPVGEYGYRIRRDLARDLLSRAMLRIGLNDPEGAFNDLLAIRRIARHGAMQPRTTEYIVGVYIEFIAMKGMDALLQHGRATADQLARMLAALDEQGPLAPVVNKFDRYERLSHLACISGAVQSVLVEGESYGPEPGSASMTPFNVAAIDWNEILAQTNRDYDEIAIAARIDDRLERRRQVASSVRRFADRAATVQSPIRAAGARIRGTGAGDWYGSILFARQAETLELLINTEDMATARLGMTRLALALARHRFEAGAAAATLEDLAPRYFETLPTDPYSGDSFVYKKQDGGFLIYSIGPNGNDDGGAEVNDPNVLEADDIAVRITR